LSIKKLIVFAGKALSVKAVRLTVTALDWAVRRSALMKFVQHPWELSRHGCKQQWSC